MSYWDTSALVKLYVQEADSARYEELALAATVVTGAIAMYEALTVFRRREAEGAIPAEASVELLERLAGDVASGGIRVVWEADEVRREFGEVLEKCFSQSPPVFIRTNDALHIASAKASGEVEFVTADVRQQTAAVLVGLTVLP